MIKTMKNTTFCISTLAAVGMVSLSSSTQAQIFTEGFNYTPGTGIAGAINPGNNTAWTGGNASELMIGSSQLTYSGLATAPGTELVYSSLGSGSTSYNTYSAVTSGSIYYSFVIDSTTVPTANEYISALNGGTSTPGGSSDDLSTYVGAAGTGGWKIGVRTTGGGSGAVYSGTLAANTTYFVVEELTLGSNPTASLFVDPVPGAAQPSATATQSTTTAINSVDDIGFKVQSSTATGDFDINNLQIGTTWASVTAPSAVPEPSSFALLGGGLALVQFARNRFQKRS